MNHSQPSVTKVLGVSEVGNRSAILLMTERFFKSDLTVNGYSSIVPTRLATYRQQKPPHIPIHLLTS